ncbi:hypothetical protein JTE90_027518 [Oedothorax gibbosus]|uniref:MADF domain-containing protein n=1 Tax=Oedothorax gibbosus TaxID=931172 RepID=A0AAV6VJ26_9ARAC|nr:hypothetical protein JTE90_027518 [Oedothorax gibbosus]
MANSEQLIALVYMKPEIWDQGHMHYSSKSMKVTAWTYIADKLEVTIDVAKGRWTNLRDLFRRELKKSLRLAEESGDPDSCRPRWKHFRSMLFLKDQMVKDDGSSSSVHYEEHLYPQTILEDGDMVKYEDDTNADDPLPESSPASTPDPHSRPEKKRKTEGSTRGSTRWPGEAIADPVYQDVWDEDYHFMMSVLPSIRRVRRDRKMSFRMKILQLIVDEEKLEESNGE